LEMVLTTSRNVLGPSRMGDTFFVGSLRIPYASRVRKEGSRLDRGWSDVKRDDEYCKICVGRF
jgi:hypothetical protein